MYEALVKKLVSKPADKFVVREAELLADEVLQIYGHIGKIGSTPIVNIAKEFGFKTIKADNIPDDISGNIFIGEEARQSYGSDKVIVVGSNEVLPHQRFIIAHELAHYLMDYLGNETYKNKLFSKTYPKINHDSFEEIRADRFAAEILMPKKVFLMEYIRAMKFSNYSKEYTITYLSRLFKVKESSIFRRIDEVLE